MITILSGRLRRWFAAVAMVAIVACAAGPALAQTETGQIVGAVADPSGAGIASATVTARSTGTGAERTASTNSEGNFVITNLLPGVYDVTVQATGFAAVTQAVQISVGSRVSTSFRLEVSGSAEQVDVVAGESGVQVNTVNQELSTVVTERQIKELPTITRNPYDLVQLGATVVNVDPEGQDPGTTSSDRGAGFNINGQRSASTNVQLDGADNNDTYSSDISTAVPLDSVQEFSVLTNNFSAEFGRASGGIVNVATKSGTNEFHGTGYEFNRLSALASASANLNAQFTPIKKGVFTRNQFGYSIGGPVIKNKLHFFQSTEWIRVRSQDTTSAFVFLPEFLAQTSASTQAFFSPYSLRGPVNGRVLTRGDILPSGSTPFTSLPAGLPVLGEVFYALPADAGGGLPGNEYQIVSRGDWTISDRTSVYGRYALQRDTNAPGTNADSPYTGFDAGVDVKGDNVLVSATHAWSDRFITQSKFAYSRTITDQPLGDQPAGPSAYLLQNVAARISGKFVALPGYLPFNPGSAIPAGGPAHLYQIYQDQTWIAGDHSVRFGGAFIRIHDDHTFGAFQNAVEELGASVPQSLDNLVLGRLQRFRVAINPQGKFPFEQVSLPVEQPNFTRNNRYNEGALYINDTWKVHPRLTLSLGLRYDYFGVQHNTDKSLDSNFVRGAGATLAEQVANGRVYTTPESPVGGLWYKDLNNFGPRVGIAWDVFGDGRTSIRGGYGVSYERNFGNVTFNVIQNPPNYAVVALTGASAGEITPRNLGPFAADSGSITLARTSLRYVDEDIRNAYAHFFSLSAERELFGNMVASLEYSGSKGVKLYSLEDINAPLSALHFNMPFDPATNPTAYLNSTYSSINARRNAGFSNYNSLTFAVQSRYIQPLGLQFLAKYTWAHTIDNLSSTFSDGSNLFNLGLLDPDDPNLDRGNADYDVRHRFITSGIWDLPFARGSEGIAKHLLDGWSVTWIFTARTGAPFSAYDCTTGFFKCNRLLQAGPIDVDGIGDSRPIAGAANLYTYIDLTNQLSNVGSYADPATGVADYGPYPSNMTARNLFRRPGYWNVDGGLYKSIHFSERYSLQLRAEFYNTFNHPNLYVNDSDVDISASPLITAYKEGRRQIQLAVKFIF